MSDPVEEATRLALRSDMLHRHGAVITRQGEIVGRGFNYRTDVFCHKFSFHAEVAAITDMRKKFPRESKNPSWIKLCQMVVVRVGPVNNLKNSCPCTSCAKYINSVGIQVVKYSTEA